MPKIFVLRHLLAEQQAKIDRDRIGLGIKDAQSVNPNPDEDSNVCSGSWGPDGTDHGKLEGHQGWQSHPDDQPLELVIRRSSLSEDGSSNQSSPPESPVRTLAARKAYDEPINISIQRKAMELPTKDKNDHRFHVSNRYHPYQRPSQPEQDSPMNLQVEKKQNMTAFAFEKHTPENTQQIQDEPMDFSKKTAEAKIPPKNPEIPFNRLYHFQRNLLVILIQKIKINPRRGNQIVRFLRASCNKIQSRGCSGGKNGSPTQNGQGSGTGGAGNGFPVAGNGSSGNSLNSSRSNSTDQDHDLLESNDTDFGNLEFDLPESATRKWISYNRDLSPLKVLDNINLKTEMNPRLQHPDMPPDLDGLDHDTANILQLSVPDPSSTFLDIGTDFGPISLYDDDPFNLEQLLPSTFNMTHAEPGGSLPYSNTPYPNTENSFQILHHNIPAANQHPIPSRELPPHIGLQALLPETTISPILRPTYPEQHQFGDQRRDEPLLIKKEPMVHAYPQIKSEEQHESIPMEEAGSPSSSGKGMSPARKKSTSSNHEMDMDEEDMANVPNLQMRIQILQQRFGIPADTPLELINGGHGIKNPMVSDVAPPPPKETEKLPPLRCETDPSRFACRICAKTFSLLRLLNRHMKCHSDTKRYLCTFCGKGFNDTFDLKRHTRTHTGVRPYKCNLCEKSFTQRCSLESHCVKVHGVKHNYEYKQRRSKVYVCEECGHTTKEPEMHYLHLKDQHPYSPALLKFYDKRHFKFNNSNFASMLLSCN